MRRGVLDGDGLHEESVAVLALELLEHLLATWTGVIGATWTSVIGATWTGAVGAHNNTSRHHNSDAATWTGVTHLEEERRGPLAAAVWTRVH